MGHSEFIPDCIKDRVEPMRATLLAHGKYRKAKRNQELPEWKVSTAGVRAAIFLGDLIGGLHRLPRTRQISRIDWSGDYVEISLHGWPEFATHDGNNMTRLVVLAHAQYIRVAIRVGMGATMLIDPKQPTGHMHFEACPGIDALIAMATKAKGAR